MALVKNSDNSVLIGIMVQSNYTWCIVMQSSTRIAPAHGASFVNECIVGGEREENDDVRAEAVRLRDTNVQDLSELSS